MAISETVIFRGITFRRYPNARQRSHRVYYSPGGTDRKNGVGALHQEIWRDEHGPIPPGNHIHHDNLDSGDNDLGNLVCLPPKEHMAKHPISAKRRREIQKQLDSVRHLAAEWHGSPEGLEFHRQLAKMYWSDPKMVAFKCDQCGKRFNTHPTGANRFCSNACKSAWRRTVGADLVESNCEICGAAFMSNKFRPSFTCSRSCSAKLRWANRRGL